jgi:hypothetical protein
VFIEIAAAEENQRPVVNPTDGFITTGFCLTVIPRNSLNGVFLYKTKQQKKTKKKTKTNGQ